MELRATRSAALVETTRHRLIIAHGMSFQQSGSRKSSGLQVQAVCDLDEFAALRPAWNALVARCRNQSVFFSHEWFDAAWQWRRLSARLHLLCLYRGTDLIALFPLVLDQAADRGSRARQLEFLTVPDTQFCDMLTAEADREVAAAAFASELRAKQAEWDVLRLRYLSEGSIAATCFRDAIQDKRGAIAIRRSADNPYVPLDRTWDEYYSTRSRSLKKANNLAGNRLKKAGKVTIDWLAPGTGSTDELSRVLEAVTSISKRSWKTRTGTSLDNPGPQAFIRRLSESARQRGWLSVWVLTLDGQPFAMEYQLVADGNVYALRSDFDADCERMQISPGSHLSRHLLEQLFGRGLRRYLMGPGENPYKYRWTEQVVPTTEMTVYGRSLHGRALEWWELGLRPLARSLRDRVRPAAPVARVRDGGGSES